MVGKARREIAFCFRKRTFQQPNRSSDHTPQVGIFEWSSAKNATQFRWNEQTTKSTEMYWKEQMNLCYLTYLRQKEKSSDRIDERFFLKQREILCRCGSFNKQIHKRLYGKS